MQAVVLAAGKGTRLRPLTDDKPKVLVEVDGTPLLEDVFDNLIDCGATELVVVVGYKKEQIIDRYGDAYEGVPITYAHQREQLGLAHGILQAEPHVDGDFMLMLGDNVFCGNLPGITNRQQEDRADDADPDDLRVFLRETLATDAALRERFFARFDESSTRSVDELRAAVDRQFEVTNPEYYVVFEPIDFSEWFDLANKYRDQDRDAAAAGVYRALIEPLDDNMERSDGAYDHFSQAFTQALDGYVDCAATADRESDRATDAVSFLEERIDSGTPFLADQFERAAAELREELAEGSDG